MNILICTDSFYPGIGGTEMACLGYADALTELGHQVFLACPSYGKMRKDDSQYKFKVIRLPSFKLTKNDYAVFAGKGFYSLQKFLGDFKPDVIHAESVSGMAKIAIKLGKKLNVPVVMTIHTKFKEAFAQSAGKFIASIMVKNLVHKLNHADQVITVADSMKNELKDYGYNGEVKVIKNGAMFEKKVISISERNAVRKTYSIEPDDHVLIFVGRMFAYKRIDFVLKAFASALEIGLKGKLILVGDGTDLDKLKALSSKLNLDDKVIFTGQMKDRTKLTKLYQISDLFVMASIFDNDPIVLVEAACCKVPSLVLENTGAAGRIKDGYNGYTAKNDLEDFSAKMVEIFKTDTEKVAQRALDTIPTTWKQTVDEHIPIYENLIKKIKQNT